VKFWLAQVLIALDQLINAIFGGWADESISSRAYRLQRRMPYTLWRFLIDLLFFWDKDHCRKSHDSERERLQLPPELRG
jgi:hypothetical protein